jgi:Na+-driven multidrug efflux pump
MLFISTGFHLNEELKEHFSAWRRLLLAAWAPSLLSLITLMFMPEAPLNLLQNGHEAESLSIYKVYVCIFNLRLITKFIFSIYRDFTNGMEAKLHSALQKWKFQIHLVL